MNRPLKTLRALLSMALIVLCCGATMAADYTFAFKRPNGWSNTPHIHIYDNDTNADRSTTTMVNNQEMLEIPGFEGWYYYKVSISQTTFFVMFNNGGWSNGQTSNHADIKHNTKQGFTATNVDASKNATITKEVEVPSGLWDAIETLEAYYSEKDPVEIAPAKAEGDVKFYRPEGWSGTPHMVAYKEKTIDRTSTNRVIYEMFVRNITSTGTFDAVRNEGHVERLKELGVDVVWLMPFYEMSTAGKWDALPSPYCIRNYTKVDGEYGTNADLKELVDALHAAGMEVWFDWIANHTGMDHAWVTEHNDYYELSNGNFVHPFNGSWGDVYQLAINNKDLWKAMAESMQYWVDYCDIDGYRCDYADGLSDEFWKYIITNVKGKNGKQLTWMAESRGSNRDITVQTSDPINYLNNSGFDYNYAWNFRDNIAEIAGNPTLDLSRLKNECRTLFDGTEVSNVNVEASNTDKYVGKSRMVFLTNHDVNNQNAAEINIFYRRLYPMTVLEFTIYGMPLIYNGQEIAYPYQIPLAHRGAIDWNSGTAVMTNIMKKLTALRHSEPALRDAAEKGKLNIFNTTSNHILAYERTNSSGTESVVVMLNFTNNEETFTVSTADTGASFPTATYYDIFSGACKNFGATQTFTLPAYGYAVYIK